MNDNNPHNVRAGQVWQDWDTRMRHSINPRYVRILRVGDTHAEVEAIPQFMKPRPIRLTRFRPNATGYRLVKGSDD